MTDLLDRSIQLINNYVSQWTKNYLYHTKYDEENNKGHVYNNNLIRFVTVFSKPTDIKPIPTATVKVYFYIPDLTDPSEKTLSFRFENDSLIHLVSRTIRLSQMEKWIETILERKRKTCRIMFLGTEFEQTRIINERMDEVLKEKRIEVEKENPQLNHELLDFEEELINQFTIPEQEKAREIKMLSELLYQAFRQVDKDDLGVISYDECSELFKIMGLELGKHQKDDILHRLDVTKTGIIEFKELSTLGLEVIHAIYCQNLALKELRDKEEESRFEAQWMLYGELRDLFKKILAECKARDEDETMVISSDSFKQILEETQQFNETEIQAILKVSGKQQINYLESDKLLEEAIFEKLVKGLVEAHKSRLQLFLIELCEKHDPEKTNKIKVSELMTAIQKCDKIKLGRAQIYALQSFIKRDDKGYVEYKEQARQISAIIKKYFNEDLIESKLKLVQQQKLEDYIPLLEKENVKLAIKSVGS